MDNIKIAQKYLKAAYDNDMDKAKGYLSENIILNMGGNNKLAGTYTGKDNFFKVFKQMLEMTNFTYNLKEQIEWLEGETRAILIAIEEAEKNGERVEYKRVIDYEIEGGEISAITIYEAQPHVVDKLFS